MGFATRQYGSQMECLLKTPNDRFSPPVIVTIGNHFAIHPDPVGDDMDVLVFRIAMADGDVLRLRKAHIVQESLGNVVPLRVG